MPIHSISIHISICIFINNLALKKLKTILLKKQKNKPKFGIRYEA